VPVAADNFQVVVEMLRAWAFMPEGFSRIEAVEEAVVDGQSGPSSTTPFAMCSRGS
jgi:hypothetical protein